MQAVGSKIDIELCKNKENFQLTYAVLVKNTPLLLRCNG